MKFLALILVFSSVLTVLSACAPADSSDEDSGEGVLQKFESKQEVLSYLKERSDPDFYSYGLRSFAALDSFAASDVAESSKLAGPAGEDYSRTNVQVQGVDEADIVKNDGEHIYVLSQDELVIVDALPAEDARIVSQTEMPGTPVRIFLNGDSLVVFSRDYVSKKVIEPYSLSLVDREFLQTLILVYDVSDRSRPALMKNFSIEGDYVEARMIEDFVYFLTRQSSLLYHFEMPVLREGGKAVSESEVYHFGSSEPSYVMNTLGSINIGFLGASEIQTFLMGHSSAVYVSPESFYVAYRKSSERDVEEESRNVFIRAVLPHLPEDVKADVNKIIRESMPPEQEWALISEVLKRLHDPKRESELESVYERIAQSLKDHLIEREKSLIRSLIHKFSLDSGKIAYEGKAEVPGTLLNQFSMDEHQGRLRVATHLNLETGIGFDPEFYRIWARHEGLFEHLSESDEEIEDSLRSLNNVYVFDEEFHLLGELEGIAPGERIYSTRFMGDRLYMVTFRNIDPFFVIDLSESYPKILGELKIPGYSDYLHPYDRNHIIGVGKETEADQFGGFSTKGVKLSLFDVSNFSSPKQVSKIEIGKSGSNSEALRDHKAFLFDREKSLVVIPVDEITGSSLYGYRNNYWQGAYVLTLDSEGFRVRGKVYHGSDGNRYGSPYRIRRSLYIGDALYTVSAKMIKANNIDDPSKNISSVDLPYERDPPPLYGDLDIEIR